MAPNQSKHIHLSAEVEAQFEDGGGIKKETQQDRTRTLKMFNEYITAETKRTVEALILKEGKSEEEFKKDLEDLSYSFSKYFWSLRVDVKVKNKSMEDNDIKLTIVGKARGRNRREGSEETHG